ncbi:hypothetical protein [Amycolatopsis nigrescens]|uniref:hypothetical protein n=1 Tax=Amycolatopsis nigrescens TaxID=381445 RepID=UPI0003A488DE|nr:hypothetical protein [Amycolatopsis nigrescens]
MRRKDPLRDSVLVLAVLAVLVSGWFGWSWWRAANDDGLNRAADRDAVLTEGTAALLALNTVDYRDAVGDVDRWVRASTGQLGKSLNGERKLEADRAVAARTVATATMKQAAVTELDGTAGTARMLAVLDLRISTNDAPAVPSRNKLNVDLERTGEGWKVSGVQAAT